MKTRFVILSFLTALSLFSAGCGTANVWGAKGGGSPATLGGNVSIPLGKE